MAIWARLREDLLFKNSFFLMLGSGLSYASGFFFWVFAGQMYDAVEVGIATSLISSLTLLVALSRMGLNESLIRYCPGGDKKRIVTTALYISAFFAVVLGIVFLTGLDLWAPDLAVAQEHVPLFLLILLAASVYSTTDATFIAMREAKWSFLQDVVNGSRMFIIFLFLGLGAIGIFTAYGLASMAVAVISIVIVGRKRLLPGRIDRDFLRRSLRFSLGNHVASILIILPATLLPIVVLNVLGPEASAFYYIAFQFAMVLNIIPNATGTSLFAEGSHGEDMRSTTARSVGIALALLVPAIIALYLLGGSFLGLIGEEYRTNGLELLRWMILSSLFYVPIQMYYSWKKVGLRTRGMMLVSGFDSVLILSLSYLFMRTTGLVGVGHAFVLAHAATAALILFWERGSVRSLLQVFLAANVQRSGRS